MEENPIDQVSDANRFGPAPGLTELAHRYLEQTRPWVRFMSVVVFVGSAITLVMALVVFAISAFGGFAAGGSSAPFGGAIVGGLLALVYVGLACLYIVPGVYLSRYASAITRLKPNCDAALLEDALKHQKSFWRFVGIMTAVGLAVGLAGMVLAVVVGAMGALAAR